MKRFHLIRTYLTREGEASEPIDDILDILKPSTTGFSGENTSAGRKPPFERRHVKWDRAAKRQFFSSLPEGDNWAELLEEAVAGLGGVSWAYAPLFVVMQRHRAASLLYSALGARALPGVQLGDVSWAEVERDMVYGQVRRALYRLLWASSEAYPASLRIYEMAPPPSWLAAHTAPPDAQALRTAERALDLVMTSTSARN